MSVIGDVHVASPSDSKLSPIVGAHFDEARFDEMPDTSRARLPVFLVYPIVALLGVLYYALLAVLFVGVRCLDLVSAAWRLLTLDSRGRT